MVSRTIRVTILNLAQIIWLLCDRLIFFLTLSYYHILCNIEHFSKTIYLKDLRVPKHIALAFSNEELDLVSISRILCWCRQLRIDQITLYDEWGRLKKVCEKPVEDLNILSCSDGRQKFCADIKELTMLHPDDITLEKVNDCVKWRSDPDLLVSFGSSPRLHGFPPWQLRLTEILFIPTHRNLPQKIFLDCLKRYSRTIQREGA